MFLWGKKSDRIKRAEELIFECCSQFEFKEKKLGKSGRDMVARRAWAEGTDAEMKRYVYYATLAASGDVIEAHHFPPIFTLDHEAISGKSFENMALEDIVGQKIGHFFERMGRVEPAGVYKTVISQVERPLIEKSLRWAEGNQLKAARALGINRNTLRKKIKELGIRLT